MQCSNYSGRWRIFERCQQDSESRGVERWACLIIYLNTWSNIDSSNSCLHGWSCSPAVFYSGVFALRCEIPPRCASPNSTRCGGSVKCIAVIVCHVRRPDAYYGMLHHSIPSHIRALTLYKDENHLSSLWIFSGVQEQHSRSRGLSILPGFCPDAVCPSYTQCISSRPHHAWERKRPSQSQGEESQWHSW